MSKLSERKMRLVQVSDEAAEVSPSLRLPYSFASAHGVMIEGDTVFHKQDVSAQTLIEVRRMLGRSFEMETLDDEIFKTRLTKVYQSNDGEAQQAVDDMGAEFDLSQLVEDIDDGELLSLSLIHI